MRSHRSRHLYKHRRVCAKGDGTDEAVYELPDGLTFAAALTKNGSRPVIVHRTRRQHARPCEQTPKLMQVLFIACPSEHFHPNRIADGHVFREQRIDPIANL